MHGTIPKQFIEVAGKPIIAYTLERFENHPSIDRILTVCIKGWENVVWNLAKNYSILKLCKVVTGGDSALSSIKKGVDAVDCTDDDIIIIHDGVRPLVDAASIDSVISDCQIYGGAISAVPLVEHIVYEGKSRTDIHYIPRENAFRAITPQAYRYAKIRDAFQKAEQTGIGMHSAFIGTMMMDLGETVCLSKGSDRNVKITEHKDLVYFKSEL